MHRRLGVTVASLAVVGVLLVSAEALAIDLGSVGSIRGTLKAYTSPSGNEIAGSVSKSDMKGRPIVDPRTLTPASRVYMPLAPETARAIAARLDGHGIEFAFAPPAPERPGN